MALSKKKKIAIVIISLLLLIGIGFGIWKVQDTQWERIFEITYAGYDYDSSYKTYSITNTTNKTFSKVTAVIEVKNWMNKTTTFEKVICQQLEPHETVKFIISGTESQEALEEADLLTLISSTEIVKIKYK